MPGRVVLQVIDAVDERLVLSLGRCGDHHLLRAGVDVLGGGFTIGEAPGGFDHEVDAEVPPRQFGRVFFREHLDAVAIDVEPIPRYAQCAGEMSVHGIVLEKVRQRRGAGQVVDGNEFDIVVAQHLRGAQDVPPDPAEPVDTYPYGHDYRLSEKGMGHRQPRAATVPDADAPANGSGARANVTARTRSAPRSSNSAAAEHNVAPVVNTSSTRMAVLVLCSAVKASARFARRLSGVSRVWVGVSRTRRS